MEMIGTPETYLQALATCLEQKGTVLERLRELTEQQEKILSEDNFDMDAFEALLEQKQTQIDTLQKLDAGFEQVYERVRETVAADPKAYQPAIEKLQTQIRDLMEIGVGLEALERRNKEKLDEQLAFSRNKVKNYNMNSQAAARYYKNMANRHQSEESYFMDKKK